MRRHLWKCGCTRFFTASLLVLLLLPFKANAAPFLEITVTSPWLSVLVTFIGGSNVKVSSIQDWNNDGELVRKIRPKTLQSLTSESFIMAFDLRDAQSIGIPVEKYPLFRSLYKTLPLEKDKIDVYLADPSVVPFVAQRILTVLADWDSANYPYYQRRLAEFQARLYSTTLAGRQILKDQKVFDLTGHSSAWLQAAGSQLIRPKAEEWNEWSEGKKIEELLLLVNKNIEQKVTVVIDQSTPKNIKKALAEIADVFIFTRPRKDQEYSSFLHDQYISLWLKMTSKPLPTPPKPQNKKTKRTRN